MYGSKTAICSHIVKLVKVRWPMTMEPGVLLSEHYTFWVSLMIGNEKDAPHLKVVWYEIRRCCGCNTEGLLLQNSKAGESEIQRQVDASAHVLWLLPSFRPIFELNEHETVW